MGERKNVAPPTVDQYDRASNRMRASFAPPTYACQKCCWPVLSGYCCNTCGDNNPSEPADESDAKENDRA